MQPLPRFRTYTRLGDYARVARDVASRRWNVGESCRQLEEEIERRVGGGHAVCAAKARVAIFLTVRALTQPGQTVVLSPYTISDVVNMVICAGCVPVFADLEPDTCNVDAAQIEKLADADTGAVLITHLHGLACDVERISRICRERGVPLIEDAAQAFGARCGGHPLGSFGDAGIYSFGMYKNVSSFFGGMIVTPDDDLAERLRTEAKAFPPQELGYYLTKVASGVATDVATWPPLFKALVYRVFRFGFLREAGVLDNHLTVDVDPQIKRRLPESYLRRLTATQARLVLAQLDRVDDDIRARIAFARRYHAGLDGVPELRLPPLRDDFSHTYTYFPIQVDDRAALLRYMMRERCDVAAQHLHNCADLECFRDCHRDCPNARRTAASVVLLPTYPRYSAADVDRNVRVIREHFGRT